MGNGKQGDIQGFNKASLNKAITLSECKGPLSTHLCWYEFSFGVCREDGLVQTPTRHEEHDARDTVHLYNDTILRAYWSLIIQVHSSVS